MGGEYKEYKANNRKKEEKELEEDLNKIEEYRKKKQEDEESKNLSKKIKKKDESDEEIDIIELYYQDKSKDPAKRRLKWLKKSKEKKPEETAIDKKQPTTKKIVPKSKQISVAEKPQESLTEADIKKELEQISNQRGQNKYSLDNVERLEFLLSKTENKLIQIQILTESTLQTFDNYANQLTSFSSDLWNKIYQDIEKIMGLHTILNQEKNELNQKDIEKMNLSYQNDLAVRIEKLENEL